MNKLLAFYVQIKFEELKSKYGWVLELEGGKISNNVTGLKIWLKNRNQRHTRDWQVLRAGFHGNGIQWDIT